MNEITNFIRAINRIIYDFDPYEYWDQYGDPETDGIERIAAEYYRNPDEMIKNVLMLGIE